MKQSVKKTTLLVLGIISGLLLLDIKEGFCENKVAPRDTSELAKMSLKAIRTYDVYKVDIKEKYGIDFSELAKMSQDKIFQFAERFMIELRIFTPSSPDEKIVMDKIRKDSTERRKTLWIYYHRAYKGIPINRTERMFEIPSNNKIPLYEIPFFDINISTAPLISKSQAVELAKKYLLENAKTLDLPDSIKDYQGFGYTMPQDLSEESKNMRLKIIKKKMKETNHLEAIKLLERCYLGKGKEVLKSQISQTSADGKVSLRVYSTGSIGNKEIHIDVRELKQVLPVKIGLKDSVKIVIFPETKDSTVKYYLAGELRLIPLPDDSGKTTGKNWIFMVDMLNGNIIECYKGWVSD